MNRPEYLTRAIEHAKRGSDLPQSKLTEADVKAIRELHAYKQAKIKRLNETLSAAGLAEKFGVSVRAIERVLQYRGWRHV